MTVAGTAYHTPGEVDAAVDACTAAAGPRAHDFLVGESVEGRPIRGVTVAAPGRTPDPVRPQTMVLANIHGVEVISSEIALEVLRRLCEPAPDPQAVAALDGADVTVVPAVNVDGRARAVASLGARRWWNGAPRRNARGVDLNRNWPWPPGARPHWLPLAGTSITWLPWHRGPAPLSEPETAALAGLFERLRPLAAVNLHSTGRIVTYPWSWRPDPPADLPRFEAMIDALRAAQPHPYRAKQSNAWYPIVGSLNDYLYERYGTLSITLESSTELAGVREEPRRARWWFWSANPLDPAADVAHDAPATLAALAAALGGVQAGRGIT